MQCLLEMIKTREGTKTVGRVDKDSDLKAKETHVLLFLLPVPKPFRPGRLIQSPAAEDSKCISYLQREGGHI